MLEFVETADFAQFFVVQIRFAVHKVHKIIPFLAVKALLRENVFLRMVIVTIYWWKIVSALVLLRGDLNWFVSLLEVIFSKPAFYNIFV